MPEQTEHEPLADAFFQLRMQAPEEIVVPGVPAARLPPGEWWDVVVRWRQVAAATSVAAMLAAGAMVWRSGGGAEEFAVGDVVAAAGNEFALHAEVNWVPVNLCVPVPEGVDPKHAAFATVGAIAMHGVRRGETQLGETACVIG